MPEGGKCRNARHHGVRPARKARRRFQFKTSDLTHVSTRISPRWRNADFGLRIDESRRAFQSAFRNPQSTIGTPATAGGTDLKSKGVDESRCEETEKSFFARFPRNIRRGGRVNLT